MLPIYYSKIQYLSYWNFYQIELKYEIFPN